MPKWLDGAPAHLAELVESLKHMQSSWFTKKFYAAVNDKDRKWIEASGLNKRQLYWLVHHPELDEAPKCPVCGRMVHFECGKTHCSQACAKKDPEVQKKVIASNIERYGTPYPLMSEQIKAKARKTCLERFGVEHSMQSDAVKEKAKETNRRNLGCDWVFQSKEKMEQARETNRRNLGCDWAMQSDAVMKKARKSNLERYGAERPLQAKECVEKMQRTMAERYGSASAFSSPELALKAKKNSRAVNWQRNRNSLLKRKSIELLTSKEEYLNADIFRYRCLICGTEFESEGTNYHQVTCPKCLEILGTSRKEKEITEFVRNLGFDVLENNRTILDGRELDLVVPSRNVAFEYNGCWWHRAERMGRTYHLEKTLGCESKGMRLVHIFSSDWMGKQDACRGLIKASLDAYDKRINANQCVIHSVSQDEYSIFINDNALNCSIECEKRLGLYLDGKLVSAAGFNALSKDCAEIKTFACRNGIEVRNGLECLCIHSGFDRLSASLDYSCCNAAEWIQCGFAFVERTEPQARWMKNANTLRTVNVESFLGESFDPSLSEAENMSLAGWTQIFDCGNLKMEWRRECKA